MLGSGGVCSGPVSWWCSEVLKCSPKVAPNPGPGTTPEPMAECEQCSLKFNFLRRRRECASCRMVYCGSCLKRGVGGTRWCHKCLVLTQWPLDLSEVTALRVKDLRQFLHSRRINTATCTEKYELIDLVTRHISSQHQTTSSRRPPPTAQHSTSHAPNSHGRHRAAPRIPVVSEDDGIRVRASSNISMGSIRVRPMDGIRVQGSHQPSTNVTSSDPDSGIRVFASGQGRSSQDNSDSASPTSPSSDGGCPGREECSHCPSDDWTASCCSLDSCHNGTPGQPHHCHHHHHHTETSSPNSEEWVFLPEMSTPSAPQDDRRNEGRVTASPTLPPTPQAVGSSGAQEEPSAPPLPQPEQEEEQPSFPTPAASSSSSSASSSAPTSAVSSPEPNKGVTGGSVNLGDLKSVEEIHQLSVRQCKELLARNRVNYSGVREKSELLNKIKILWEDYRTSRKEFENLPEEMICKICMDHAIDCVLLECGHMVSCTQCGKQMSECPLCRQYVVRVVRTFRA